MSNDEAEQIIGLHGTLPRLVVFDLDYTLWPFYWLPLIVHKSRVCRLDLTTTEGFFPPFLLSIHMAVLLTICVFNLSSDLFHEDHAPDPYPHALGILHALKARGIDMAIASRSRTPEIARLFLEKLGVRSMFVAEEIFTSFSYKTKHFQKIHKKTGIPFESMLFFDDDISNIKSVSKMGVTSILVRRGVTLDSLRQGLSDFEQKSTG